ncbi:MAG: DUF1844 domain-containing protein [Planctomycetes bacterium]|nr:DUF1844 domain-containing protein [Planctomycetota bacterium]
MSEDKKIIIDDDWKSQVAAEKEELKREAEEQPAESPPSQEMPPQEMPPASFEMLMTMFATEAMAALGQLPNPMTNELSINIEHARYAIDMLQMLEEKTKGNLEPNEAKTLEDLLHQLRMLFVAQKPAT